MSVLYVRKDSMIIVTQPMVLGLEECAVKKTLCALRASCDSYRCSIRLLEVARLGHVTQ